MGERTETVQGVVPELWLSLAQIQKLKNHLNGPLCCDERKHWDTISDQVLSPQTASVCVGLRASLQCAKAAPTHLI